MKWFPNGPDIRAGDLVLLAEDNEAPLQWKTGRVVEVYTGNDDIVRVCKVKTPTSLLIRPVIKLRKHPMELPTGPNPAEPAHTTSGSSAGDLQD